MYEFRYHRPTSLADARQIIDAAESPSVIAGGMTLLPTMKLRLARASDLVDLGAIEALRGLRLDGRDIVIGAMVAHADVAASSLVRDGIPALSELAGAIGDAQVRNRGTLGGSVANSDPAADYPAALLGLGATIRTDRRNVPADDYFVGMFETALETNEIIEQVRFPTPKRAAYAKFPNPASRYAVVGVFVAETDRGMRVAVTGAGACVYRESAMEAALDADFSAAAIDGIGVDASDFNGDLHASPEYRAHLVGVMAKRAVRLAGG